MSIGAFVLLATLDWLWGNETWQWAAEARPGGAYGFAGFLGVVGPCLTALAVFCLCRTQWKSWRQHPWRTLVSAGACIASTAALLPFVVLALNAQYSGRRRGRDGTPSWVFSNYPWLWAVGLLSTLAAIVLSIWIAVVHYRR